MGTQKELISFNFTYFFEAKDHSFTTVEVREGFADDDGYIIFIYLN